MPSTKTITNGLTPKLMAYALQVLQESQDPMLENRSCLTILRWLQDNKYDLKSFLIAYALHKYRDCDQIALERVTDEFKQKHKAELIQRYGVDNLFLFPRWFASSESPLYLACQSLLNADSNGHEEIKEPDMTALRRR